MKNRYVRRARISEEQFKEILKFFALDIQANQISQFTGLSRNSINSYLRAMRHAIVSAYTHYDAYAIRQTTPPQLFGIQYKQNMITVDPIPSQIAQDFSKHLKEERDSYIDSVLSAHYSALIDYTHKKFYYLQHEHKAIRQNRAASAFWAYTKIRLAKFRGLSTESTFLHLKESEFRYNYRGRDIYRLLLSHFRKHPLKL